jgi:hypothetical protein
LFVQHRVPLDRVLELGELGRRGQVAVDEQVRRLEERRLRRELLDRVMGKPRQSLEVSSEGPAMLLEALGLTAAQRARRAAELEERDRESPSLPEADDAETWPDA